MTEAFRRFLKNYIVIEGRANRAEFLYIILWNLVAFLVFWFGLFVSFANQSYSMAYFFVLLYSLWGLLTLIPSITLIIRRLHDTNQSGWFCLLILIPIGVFIVFIMCIIKGTPGENKYGMPSDFK